MLPHCPACQALTNPTWKMCPVCQQPLKGMLERAARPGTDSKMADQAQPPVQLTVPCPPCTHGETLVASPAALRCHCCHGIRHWRSIFGVVICAQCHPPADVALVTRWEGEE